MFVVKCCMRVSSLGYHSQRPRCYESEMFFNIVLCNEYHELFLHVIKKLVIDKISSYCAHV